MNGTRIDTDTLKQLTGLIEAELGVARCDVTSDTRLLDLDGWDSIKTIGLILAIERQYGFLIDVGAVDSMERVGDFMQAIAAGRG